MQRLFCVLEKVSEGKVSKGKVSESKGEGSYQLVGWVERSETQQVSELRGERGKLRVSRCGGCRRFNAEKRVIRYQSSDVRLRIQVSEFERGKSKGALSFKLDCVCILLWLTPVS